MSRNIWGPFYSGVARNMYGPVTDPTLADLSSFTPDNYTPTPTGADGLAQLVAHLRGIDNQLANIGTYYSRDYYFFSRCSDGSGNTLSHDVIYLDQTTNDASITTATNSWGTANKFATTESAAVNQAARITTDLAVNLANGDSFLLAYQMNATTPAAATYNMGTTSGTGAGFSTRVFGSGVLGVNVADGTNNVLVTGATTVTGSEKAIVVVWDGQEMTVSAWIAGTIDANINAVDISSVTGSTAFTASFSIGSAASLNNSIAATYDNIHILPLWGRGAPADMASLVAAYGANPHLPFTIGQLAA